MTNQTDRIRRNTTFAVVERIRDIEPHPDPKIERLEVIVLTSGVKLVTGKHYRIGDRGVYLRPGCLIPGWLAEQLWLVGKKRAIAWFEVRSIPIGVDDGIKVQSPGLWCGEWYRNDTSPESAVKAEEMLPPSLALTEAAWGLIANAGGGDWTKESAEWREAAVRWRRDYFIALGKAVDGNGFLHWPFWREEWKEGFTLDGHFGIVEAEEVDHVVKHPKEYTRQAVQS